MARRLAYVSGCMAPNGMVTTPPPELFDLDLYRCRTARLRDGALFLYREAALLVQERLREVNRTFQDPVIVARDPAVWVERLGDAAVLAPAATLGLEKASRDLVVHGLWLTWANDPLGALIQTRLALRPDGLMLATLFAGDTLHELREALAEAEAEMAGGLSPRVAPMAPLAELAGLLQRAGFAMPVADLERFRVSYETPFQLMRELRAMGETNALRDRLRRPTRRAVLDRAAGIYAGRHAGTDGRIRATFEIAFLTGWAPGPDQPVPKRPGSATARLAEALGSREHSAGEKAGR
jgi:SAM-dependent methyltransferase